MEFKFNINNLFGDDISKIDCKLHPFRKNHSSANFKSQLCTVIDDMGVASAKAQGLNGAITSASRLAHSDHHLYVMKDAHAHGGEGSVVGILKVGHKRLFVYDHHGNQHEMEPLCVLDFYVHESKQRTGCGKKLFELMCKEEQTKPGELAIDRPSAKFLNFLTRHYNLKAIVNQVNNFVIFEGFFKNRPPENNNRRPRGKPPLHLYRQQSVDRWQHPLESASGGAGRSVHATVPSQIDREASGYSGGVQGVPGVQRSGLQRSGLQRSGLQRLLAWTEPEDEPEKPIGKEALKNVRPREGLSTGVSDRPSSGSHTGALVAADSPTHRAMGAQLSMYSRHQDAPASAPVAKETGRGLAFLGLVSTPPMLRRDGPPADYLALRAELGSASVYQDRRGHLVVSAETSPTRETPPKSRHALQNGQGESLSNPTSAVSSPKHAASSRQPDSSWNLFGAPASPKHSAARKHQHTRLW